MTDDVRDPAADAGGHGPNPTPLSTRVAAARTLLEECDRPEYEALTTTEQVHIQEAIEHLRQVESRFPGGEPRE